MNVRHDYSRFWLTLAGSTLVLTLARADAPAPPADFWLYMAEFSDDAAEVFDPSDFALTSNLPGQPKQETTDSSTERTTPQHTDAQHGATAEQTP